MNYAEKVWDTINRAWNGDSRLIKEEKKMLNFDKYKEE